MPVIAQSQGSDAASVVFDAVQAAQARNVDVLLVDTAGRLQAKTQLMDELAKVRRVVQRLDPDAPHEVILVLDGGVGQNALSQVELFREAVGVTGLVVSKSMAPPRRCGVRYCAERTGGVLPSILSEWVRQKMTTSLCSGPLCASVVGYRLRKRGY